MAFGGQGSHRMMNRVRSGGFCPYLPGLYTEAEIDDLVFIDGYIPVYDSDEFDKLRTGASEVMGGCTKWGGTYTTGNNKKYVQVGVCDFTGVSWIFIGPTADFIYDSNEIAMFNLSTIGTTSDVHLLSATTAYTFKNARIFNFDIDKQTATNCGLLGACNGTVENVFIYNSTFTSTLSSAVIIGSSVGATISNCLVSGCTVNGGGTGGANGIFNGTATVTNCSVSNTDLISTGAIGGIGNGASNVSSCTFSGGTMSGASGAVCGILNGFGAITVEDCVVENCTITSSTSITGGIAQARSGAIIRKCRIENVDITVTGTRDRIGGISGLYFSGGTIQECEVINCNIDAPNSTGVGGIVGYDQSNNTNIIENCRVIGGTINGNSDVGGIMGRALQANTTNINSFSTAAVTGNSNVGGAYGRYSGATITAVYWDTVASGNATSAAGTGQTTSALQTPTSNTGIYSAWTIPPWTFGGTTDYPSLTTTP